MTIRKFVSCFIFPLRSAAVFSFSQSIVADVHSLMAETTAKRQKTKVAGVDGLDGKIGNTSDSSKS